MKKLLIILGLLFCLSIGYGQITISSADCGRNNTRNMGSGNRCTQSFRGQDAILDSVALWIKGAVGVTGNARVNLYAHSGEYGVSSTPSGDSLAVSDTVDCSTFPTADFGWVIFRFSGVNKVTLDTSLRVIQITDQGAGLNSYYVGSKSNPANPNLCHLGNVAYGTTAWTVYYELDMLHFIYGSTIPASTGGQVIIISR